MEHWDQYNFFLIERSSIGNWNKKPNSVEVCIKWKYSFNRLLRMITGHNLVFWSDFRDSHSLDSSFLLAEKYFAHEPPYFLL